MLATCVMTGCAREQNVLSTTEAVQASELQSTELADNTNAEATEDAAYQLELEKQAELTAFRDLEQKNYYAGIVDKVKYGGEIEEGFGIERSEHYDLDNYTDKYVIF